MNIKGIKADATITKILKSINTSLASADRFVAKNVDTGDNGIELKPPVNLIDAKYVFDNSSYVAKCCRILAKDLLLNDITITVEDDEDNKTIELINEYLNDNIDELYYTAVDYYYAGIGAFEFGFDLDEFQLKQIPIHTTKIIRAKVNGRDTYLLKQQIQTSISYFKIMGEKYPDNFDTYQGYQLGECCIIGGDNFYQFFSEPLWLQEQDKIFTEISIGSKNLKQISNGNIASGVLNINLEPQIKTISYDEDGNQIQEPTPQEVMSEELQNSNGGTAVLFTVSQKPIKLDYVKLENDNYEYLTTLQEKSENAVLNCYGVPLARLMINTEKESMNSDKTKSIWEIYTLDLRVEQRKWKNIIKELIQYIYGIKVTCNIETPIFSDRREKEINNIINEWNNGLITLKQAIIGLAKYDPNIDINEYDFTQNVDLWEYRKIDAYYDLLNEVDMSRLDDIDVEINELK